MNRVPHCKECKYFKIHKPTYGKINNLYECTYNRQYPYINYIYSKDIKTSPAWCYKRVNKDLD